MLLIENQKFTISNGMLQKTNFQCKKWKNADNIKWFCGVWVSLLVVSLFSFNRCFLKFFCLFICLFLLSSFFSFFFLLILCFPAILLHVFSFKSVVLLIAASFNEKTGRIKKYVHIYLHDYRNCWCYKAARTWEHFN